MQESNNLKAHKSGINKSREWDERLIDGITIAIAIVGCLNWNLSLKVVILILLGIFYAFTKHRINALNTDNKFLDEDIIQFRELVHELEAVKNNNQNNNKKLQQVTSIVVTLHRTVKNLDKCLSGKSNKYEEFKKALSVTIKEIFDILTTFYVDYQEHLTIALYIYCPQTDEYMDFISCKPEIMNKKKGRLWGVNDNSHICQAVRQIKMDSNIRDFVYDNIKEELPPVKNSNINDESEYVSSISIPILYDGHKVQSVLSITSNYPNRFRNAKSKDFQEIRINRIFVDLFYAISQIIEVVIKNNLKVINENIIRDILTDYFQNDREKLKEKHIKLLQELSSNSSEVVR